MNKDSPVGRLYAPPQPKIVTLAELRRVLLSKCYGWKWAERAIYDLWQKGAPIPVAPGQPEMRILLPGQFKSWWQEIQRRMGLSTHAEEVYQDVARTFRTGSGVVRRRDSDD
jgi:hypothetical protein